MVSGERKRGEEIGGRERECVWLSMTIIIICKFVRREFTIVVNIYFQITSKLGEKWTALDKKQINPRKDKREVCLSKQKKMEISYPTPLFSQCSNTCSLPPPITLPSSITLNNT